MGQRASPHFAVQMLLLVVPRWPIALTAALSAGQVSLLAERRVADGPPRDEAAVVAGAEG